MRHRKKRVNKVTKFILQCLEYGLVYEGNGYPFSDRIRLRALRARGKKR